MRAAVSPVSRQGGRPRRRGWSAGFTLIELMMVLGILAIILGIGLPAVVSTVRKGPMRQAVSDLEEGCLKARMLAILTGTPTELVISARDGSLTVRQVSESGSPAVAPGGGETAGAPPETPAADEAALEEAPRPEPLPSFSAQLHESIAFRTLNINLHDMMDEAEAAIRFYPNGTCDAFTATLVGESGEERVISLEITTGRTRVETIR